VESKPLVFLNYASEDENKVKNLKRQLSRLGFVPWMPTVNVLPGQEKQSVVSAAINKCAFFLVCLTKIWGEISGPHQAHCNEALEKWYEHSDGDVFLVPVLLEKESIVPDKLARFETVNYFEKDGWKKLSQALCEAMARRRKEQGNLHRKRMDAQKSRVRLPAPSNWPPRQLIQAIAGEQKETATRCSVMIGNGLSEGVGYPSWSEILTQMAKLMESGRSRKYVIELRNFARKDPLSFVSLVKRQKKQSYYGLVKRLFEQEGKRLYSNLHRYLLDTDFHSYLTTNFDCCLENAARMLGRLSDGVFYYPDYIRMKAIQNRHGAICHLHGFLYRYDQYWERVQHRPDQLVLASEDFYTLYASSSTTRNDPKKDAATLLDSVFQEGTLLFVGYTLSDPVWCKLLDHFDALIDMLGNVRRNRHYALMPLTSEIDSPRIQRDYLLNRYGIEVEFFPSSVDRKGQIDFTGLEDCLKELKEETLKYRMREKMKTKSKLFLSYAREDEEAVKKLYQRLARSGFKPWMDQKDILPGEQWKPAIQKAVREADFFLACLSNHSVNKRGFIQKEIRDALDAWQEKLESDVYLIPVRLEDCDTPDSLRSFQWVSLFEKDGWAKLILAIQEGEKRRHS